MAPRYGMAFFYGILLDDNDIRSILKQIERYKPPVEVRQAEGFYEEAWYSDNIFTITDTEPLFSTPTIIKSLRDPDEMDKLCLVVENTFHAVDETVFAFELQIQSEEWDKRLKAACEQRKITWRKPSFHLLFDYHYGRRESASYEGIFFYGVIATKFDWKKFMKRVCETNREVFFHDVDWTFEICKVISKEKVQAWEDSYNQDKDEFTMDFKSIVKSILDSNAFIEWIPDNKTISWISYNEIKKKVLQDLRRSWAKQEDPLFIDSMFTMEKFVIYLGIRATYHSIEGRFDERAFDLNDKNKLKWNYLLKAKCDEYGIECGPPSFYILRKHP